MGGYGSGRWYRHQDRKEIVEENNRLDVRFIQRRGYLTPGALLKWSWGEKHRIDMRVWDDRVVLLFRWRVHGGEWQDVEEVVRLEWTPCHYGGKRPWWICPQCGKRVAILYGAGKFFLCRHCSDLAYCSQQENRADRLLRKARKIRRRLGATGNGLDMPVSRPPRMHWETYARLRVELLHTEQELSDAWHAELVSLYNRAAKRSGGSL